MVGTTIDLERRNAAGVVGIGPGIVGVKVSGTWSIHGDFAKSQEIERQIARDTEVRRLIVDATELALEPGLTGIVGPNGCGKSNLVEALRWVMGETSARRLRGGEMDDVIFAGTAAKPARNIAEVALTLDNSNRDAPFAFNDRAEIEVVRRIERGGGSTYRVNGRARISTDPLLRSRFAVDGKEPATVTVVAVEQAFPHCPKALVRSNLWRAAGGGRPKEAPTLGDFAAARNPGTDAAAYNAEYAKRMPGELY